MTCAVKSRIAKRTALEILGWEFDGSGSVYMGLKVELSCSKGALPVHSIRSVGQTLLL